MMIEALTPVTLKALSPTQVDGLRRLGEWDFDRVKRRVVEKSIEFPVDRICNEYRKYLAAIVINPSMTLGMWGSVDIFWHEHLLFTRDYAAMCFSILGQFIHHEPESVSNSPRSIDDQQATLMALSSYFNNFDGAIWSVAIGEKCGGDRCGDRLQRDFLSFRSNETRVGSSEIYV